MNFGQLLKELRLSKHLTQEQLSEKLGVSKSRISMYENGKREPSFEMLESLADFFNVNLDMLLRGSSVNQSQASFQPDTLFIEKYGQDVYDAAMAYKELDEIDRARIMERMGMLLEDDKYKEVSKVI